MTVVELAARTKKTDRTRPVASAPQPPAGLDRILATWRRRRAYRDHLRRLLRVGPYMIDDIGLTVEAARREIAKPFWRP